MLALDRNAFICDMAETYRIYDIKSVPLHLLAILASGLGYRSRIRLKQDNMKVPVDVILLAEIVDLLTAGETGHRSAAFMLESRRKQSEFQAFVSMEEFEIAKAKILADDHIEKEETYGGY